MAISDYPEWQQDDMREEGRREMEALDKEEIATEEEDTEYYCRGRNMVADSHDYEECYLTPHNNFEELHCGYCGGKKRV